MALYRCVGGGTSGTAITPDNSASPPTLTQGETYTITGNNGLAIQSASSLTPANASPPSITSGNYYRASSSGYAISSYSSSSKTPSSSGVSFSSGWNRMTASGYAYSTQAKVTGYSLKAQTNISATSYQFTGLTSGNKYLLVLYNSSSSSTSYARFDNATCSGGTLTKLTNLFDVNSYGFGTFFVLNATSNSVTVSATNSFRLRLFEATI